MCSFNAIYIGKEVKQQKRIKAKKLLPKNLKLEGRKQQKRMKAKKLLLEEVKEGG